MNRFIISFILIFGIWTVEIQAQVIIHQNNFPQQAEFLDSFAGDRFTNMLPTEGAEQIWDYSALQENEIFTTSYIDATNDTEITGALNFRESLLFFLGSTIPRVVYAGVDEAGYYDVGSAIEETTFPIGATSGGANDSLRFIAKKAAFEGRIDFLQFPVTYEKKWEGSDIERIDLELSIAAFGLDKTPGQLKREETQKREVVGYGQLVIPRKDGTATDPIDGIVIVDALLIKVEQSYVDSFFLAGAPAPTALLDAFQLTQGVSIIAPSSRYLFFTPGFGSPVLAIGFDEDEDITFISYRPQVTERTTSIKEVNWQSLKSFPNPVLAGTMVNIQLDQPTSQGRFHLSDSNGKIIQETVFTAASKNQFSVKIPTTTLPGLYIYQVFDKKGGAIGRGKLLVN